MDQDTVTGRERRMTVAAARSGIMGVALFVCSTAAMHMVQPELSPVHDAISYYMNGRLGWVLGWGLVALGSGSLATAVGLKRFQPTRKTRVGAGLLVLWSLGVIAGGIFPPDPLGSWDGPPSLSGMIHGGAAMVAFLSFPAAALLLSHSGAWKRIVPHRRDHLRVLAVLSAAMLIVFFICLAPAFMNRTPYFLGLAERVLLGLFVAWLFMVNGAMARAAEGASSSPGEGGYIGRPEAAIRPR